MPSQPTIFWFRKALRLHDNPALLAAIDGASKLYPVFCLDPWFVSSGRVGNNRLHFLLQSLQDLDSSLRALDSRLIVLRGDPEVELPRAIRAWNAERLAYEIDTEPYAKIRDAKINEMARERGVQVVTRWGHTLTDLDALLKRHPGGKPTTTYSSFLNHLDKQLKAVPLAVLNKPRQLPPVVDADLAGLGASAATSASSSAAPASDAADAFGVPSAAALCLGPATSGVILRGGETEALARMEACLSQQGGAWVAAFEKPSTSPTEIDPFGQHTRSTTCLSPYLKFGCLSARVLHERVAAVYAAHPKHAKPPTSLHGQVYWREFYYACAHGTPNYEMMAANPICRQIPWEDDPELLAAWREARTGYPWIDAAMTQLREEGWIHHLARHAVACFLTRGDLWQSWEKGAEVFEELLLDADPAINRGNWMWLSCSCFFYQYFRCYSPVAFPQKYDKDGAYVRKWLPQLKDFPAKYIYEPWKAPIADQKKANCIIGQDYPKPIVNHELVSKANMDRMNKAYAAHKAAGGGGGGDEGGGDKGDEGDEGDEGGEGAAGGGSAGAGKKRALTQQKLPMSKKVLPRVEP
jgi:cryptochrome